MFLEDELPIRLAHRVVELENLPYGLSAMPSVIRVKNWYAESFQELIEFPKIELPLSMKHKLRGMNIKRLVYIGGLVSHCVASLGRDACLEPLSLSLSLSLSHTHTHTHTHTHFKDITHPPTTRNYHPALPNTMMTSPDSSKESRVDTTV